MFKNTEAEGEKDQVSIVPPCVEKCKKLGSSAVTPTGENETVQRIKKTNTGRRCRMASDVHFLVNKDATLTL